MLPQKHSVFHANTRDQIDQFLQSKVAGAIRAVKPIDDVTRLNCSVLVSERFKIFSISCKFSGISEYEPFEDIRLVCPIQSVAQISFAGQTIDIDPHRSNYILPAGTLVTKHHRAPYRVLSARISTSDLEKKLEALSGKRQSGPIVFAQPDAADGRFVKFIRRPLFAVAQELDRVDPVFHDNLLEEIEAVTLTRLLLFAPHNFSHLLAPHPRAPGRAQMRLAEDYLAANWNKTLDVTGLANAVGVSARTVLRYFRDSYGVTPRDYLRQVRLERARAMMREGSESTTVVEVALNCGFSSLGNFAASYKQTFGELPSDTLRYRPVRHVPDTERYLKK